MRRLAPRIRPLCRAAIVLLAWAAFAWPYSPAAADFRALFEEALDLRQQEHFSAAEEKLRQALQLQPRSPEALMQLGLVLAFRKEYEAALEVLDRASAIAPNDMDVVLALARVKSWSGRPGDAAADVERVLTLHPDNVEAINLKGRLAYYQERLGPAEEAFRSALTLDPENLEALLGLSDVLLAKGDLAAAGKVIERAVAGFPRSAEAEQRADRLRRARQQAVAVAPPVKRLWRVDASYAKSRFSRVPRKEWHEGTLQLGRRISDAATVHAGGQLSRRFGKKDTMAQVGGSYRFQPWLIGSGELGITPAADFLPRWDGKLGGALRAWPGNDAIGASWLTLDLRQRHYATGDVRDANPGVQQYFLDGRLWLTGRWLHSRDLKADKPSNGWFGRLDVRPADFLLLYAGRSRSSEVDSGVSVATHTTLGGAVFRLSEALDLRLDFTHEQRSGSYIRNVLSLGMTARF